MNFAIGSAFSRGLGSAFSQGPDPDPGSLYKVGWLMCTYSFASSQNSPISF